MIFVTVLVYGRLLVVFNLILAIRSDAMLTKDLSQKQIEAVNAIDEDVEIIACAGAGKTRVVTRRIVNT